MSQYVNMSTIVLKLVDTQLMPSIAVTVLPRGVSVQ